MNFRRTSLTFWESFTVLGLIAEKINITLTSVHQVWSGNIKAINLNNRYLHVNVESEGERRDFDV